MQEVSGGIGLSFPAVTRAINIGLEQGLFAEKGIKGGDRGRKAQLFGISADYGHSLSIYIDKNILYLEVRNFLTEKVKSEQIAVENQNIIEVIDAAIESNLTENDKIKYIFMIVGGTVFEGKILNCRDYTALSGFDMQAHLSEKFDKIIIVENDMQACANSYLSKDELIARKTIIAYTFGKRAYGAGVIINGHILKGATGQECFLCQLPIDTIDRPSSQYYARQLQTLIAVFNPHTVILYPNDENISSASLMNEILAKLPSDIIPKFQTRQTFMQDCILGMTRLCLKQIKSSFK